MVAVVVTIAPVVTIATISPVTTVAVIVVIFHTLSIVTMAITISLVLGINTQRDHQHQQDCHHTDDAKISKLLHHFI